jgi:hypothetical protein
MTPTPAPFFATPAPKHAAQVRAQPQTAAGWIVAFPDTANERAARAAAIRGIAMPASQPKDGDPAARARAVLADPVFSHPKHDAKPAQKSAWDRFWEWVGDRINEFFHAIFRHAVVGKDASSALGIAALLAAVLVLVVVLARVLLRTQRATFSASDAAQGGFDPQQLLAAADARAATGDFAGAVIGAFVAGLARLDRSGVVAYDATLTPNEYRRLVRSARPDLADPFDRLTRAFVPAAYDDRPLDAVQYAVARSAYEAIAVVAQGERA